jgi:hypothetical protein
MKQKIKFTGEHLDGIFSLPCVKGICKTYDGTVIAVVDTASFAGLAYPGDEIVEKDNGEWMVISRTAAPMNGDPRIKKPAKE